MCGTRYVHRLSKNNLSKTLIFYVIFLFCLGHLVFSHKGNVSVSRGNLVKTFKNYGPEFYVEFKIRISSALKATWANILHVTNGPPNGAHGNRFPGIWVNKAKFFRFASTVNSNVNYEFDRNMKLGEVYHIVVSQQFNDQSQLVYKVVIDGKEVHSVVNTNGITLKEAKLYLSNPWYASINDVGEISDLTVISGEFLILQVLQSKLLFYVFYAIRN